MNLPTDNTMDRVIFIGSLAILIWLHTGGNNAVNPRPDVQIRSGVAYQYRGDFQAEQATKVAPIRRTK
jgi:hypothetical protein